MNIRELRRVYSLAKLIKNKEIFSKTEAARRFNVSRQTIHRDIEWIERNKQALPFWREI